MKKEKSYTQKHDKKEKLKRIAFLIFTAILFESLVLSLFPSKVLLYEKTFSAASMQYIDYQDTSFAVPDSVVFNMADDIPFSLPYLSTNYTTVEDNGKMQIAGPHFYLCTKEAKSFPETKNDVQALLNDMMPGSNALVLEDPVFDEVIKGWKKGLTSVSLPQYQSDDGVIKLNGSGYLTFVENESGKIGALLICSDSATNNEQLAKSRMDVTVSVAKSYRLEDSNGTFIDEQLNHFHIIQVCFDVGNLIVLCVVLKLASMFFSRYLSNRKEHTL